MILVYTNSKERAMLLAVNIDGVVLSDKRKVWPDNYHELKPALEEEFSRNGYIRTFFRGESCAFVYTDGCPCVLAKMVDYDPSYAILSNRPTPFIPEHFEVACVDDGLNHRAPLYRKMWSDSNKVINAASDDIEGELSFKYFMDLCSIESYKPIFRVRPHTMVETDIIEEFNALEASEKRAGFISASDIYSKMNWLVAANASNALTKSNPKRLAMAIGRTEALLLSQIYERYKESKKAVNRFKVTATISVGSKEIEATSAKTFASLDAANTALRAISGSSTAIVKEWLHMQFEERTSLLNAFTTQSKACARDPKLTPSLVADALEWLFYNGFITWPSQETSMPWDLKPQFTTSITSLSQTPLFEDRVLPKDVDDYLDWDSDRPLFDQTGIIVTDKLIPDDIRPLYRLVYEVIAAANIMAIKTKQAGSVQTAKFDCAGHELAFFRKDITPVPLHEPKRTKPSAVTQGTECHILSARVVRDTTPEYYAESELIEEMDGLLKGTFSFSLRKISSAIDNLVAWGHVTVQDGRIELTEKGLQTCRHLQGTALFAAAESLNWDKRLLAFAQNKASGAELISDIKDYVDDICSEIIAHANELSAMGGYPESELSCPICGNSIEFFPSGGCECISPSCSFDIPEKILNHTMSKLDIAELLSNKMTSLITDFTSKKGTYAARFVLNSQGKVERSFACPHRCRYCGSEMKEYMWGIKCSNSDCGFSLNTSICEHRLTDGELTRLLSGEQTDTIRFVNSAKKAFAAKLTLKEDKTLEFVFPQKNTKQTKAASNSTKKATSL